MSPVIDAKLPENISTSSNTFEDWYGCFERDEMFTTDQLLKLPEFLLDLDDWKRSSQKIGTARIIETIMLGKNRTTF
jgi:hypothetical protein